MRALADIDPFDPEVVQEPHEFFAALRREAPLYRLPNGAYSLISRYRDVREAAMSPEVYSSNLVAVMMQGIDAPELGQSCSRSGRSYSCGETSRRALIDLVSGQIVRCRAAGRDRYQRILARCAVNGQDIGARMVEDGWAVSYGRDYDYEETRARNRSVGLWEGAFERPQDWRKGNS